ARQQWRARPPQNGCIRSSDEPKPPTRPGTVGRKPIKRNTVNASDPVTVLDPCPPPTGVHCVQDHRQDDNWGFQVHTLGMTSDGDKSVETDVIRCKDEPGHHHS